MNEVLKGKMPLGPGQPAGGILVKIVKVLNNNAVVVMDEGQEKVAVGAGIAFEKKKNDIVNIGKVEKIFAMKENKKLEQLLNRIAEEHFDISEVIISHAEEYMGVKLDEHVHIVLADHLSFAIEREKEGIYLKNKLLHEIKILYRREFEVGLWAIKYIEKRCGVKMPVDEAAFIALHIHTSKVQGGDLRQVVRLTTIVRDMVQMIKDELDISVEEDDLAYQRLTIHLRFALTRAERYERHVMDDEMLHMIKTKFSESYECAKSIADYLLSKHGIELPEREWGYVTLHIERLRKQ